MKSPTTKLRRADSRDTRALSLFGRASFSAAFAHLYTPQSLESFLEETRSEVAYAKLIAAADCALILAELSRGEIGGYVLCGPLDLPVETPPASSRQLERLYIHPSHQSAGIGQQLLEAAIDWATRASAPTLYLGVYSENHGAQRFYARAGFEIVGEYGFKVGEHTDHEFIMALTL